MRTIIIALIIAVIVIAIIVKGIINMINGKSSCACGGGCKGCAMKDSCHPESNNKSK